ncbi:MAG: response regulator [Vulcanimicrobiota bacterium]
MSSKILVVDDEKSMVEIIKYSLEKAGYTVTEAYDGREAIDKARAWKPDLIVLDVMLPIIDGYEVCKQLSTEMQMPIIMVTAKDDEIDKVIGLELGADDYLTKPFSPRELVARVRAHLRRFNKSPHEENHEEKVFLELVVNQNRREVFLSDRKIDLTPREFDLLAYLIEHKDRVITREVLLDHVWGYDYYGDSRIVNVTIARLREKIEKDPSNPRYIVTHRGVGYMFQDPGENQTTR